MTCAVPTLLLLFTSAVPAGGAMMVLLMTVPTALPTARNTTVKVLPRVAVPLNTDPATVRLVNVLPLATDTLTKVSVPMPTGKVSVRRAPVTASGPALAKVNVNVVVPPTNRVGVLAVFKAEVGVGANDDIRRCPCCR